MSSEHFHEELDGIHPGFGDSGRGCALMLERSVVTPAESWARVTKEQGLISRGTRARLCLCWDAGHGHSGRDVRSRDIPGFPSSWLELSLSLIKEQQVPWRAQLSHGMRRCGLVTPTWSQLLPTRVTVPSVPQPPPRGHLGTGDTIDVPTHRCGILADVGFGDILATPFISKSPERRLLVLG